MAGAQSAIVKCFSVPGIGRITVISETVLRVSGLCFANRVDDVFDI